MDPFATLGAPRRFDLDLRAVEKAHRELSRALHPDRYVAAGASERRAALERAVLVNEAWRVVRDPVARAEALFTLAGVKVGDTHEPKPPADLLMEMMEAREELSEVRAKRDIAGVRRLIDAMTVRKEQVERALAAGLDGANGTGKDLAPLVGKLGELRYCRRFLEEAEAVQGDLEEPS
jgi:molecular chaperone HscB